MAKRERTEPWNYYYYYYYKMTELVPVCEITISDSDMQYSGKSPGEDSDFRISPNKHRTNLRHQTPRTKQHCPPHPTWFPQKLFM